MILVGTESNYLSDIHPEVEEYQTVSESYLEKAKDLSHIPLEVEKAKHYFIKKTEELQKRYSITKIQYDNPKKIGDSYHINYRYLSDNAKRGIVKGQMEENENVKETILREVAEEVGVKIEIDQKTQDKIVEHGVCNKYNVFSLNISKKRSEEFEMRIEQRIKKKLGEVFDLKFEPLCSVLSSLSSFNNRSKCAIEKFRDYKNACNN
jgi:DNA-binding transcriptional regulator YhcF (GntR family)